MSAYAPAAGCEPYLNSWCNSNCPHAERETLYARLDTNQNRLPEAWRCYAASTLDSDHQQYVGGTTYCTRHPQLMQELEYCQKNGLGEAFQSEVAYGAGAPGDAADAPPPAANAGRSAAGAAAQQSFVTPPSAETCEDTVDECRLWATYGECQQNAPYMLQSCRASCQACQQGTAKRAGSPPKVPPLPPSSPPPSSPSPPSSESACRNACDPVAPAPAGCSARGQCSPWNGKQWCMCGATREARYVGLQCERELRDGGACLPGCDEHGSCINGYCECDRGWHGAACNQSGAADAFLTASALFDAGLVRGRKGSKAAGKAACEKPSYHQAYARDASKMKKLLASLPEQHVSLQCSTCALVSNAGSLLGQGRGPAIDENECVWRMNRAPTKGFEADVGSKTTLDMTNSYPHLRNINILPRPGSPLLHGMTVEIFDHGGTGYDKYMGWVDGHATYKEQWPHYEAHIFDVAWMQDSWEAYWAYLASWASPLDPPGRMARPSSGWHMARLALSRCDKVNMYGFSMASDKFHCAAHGRIGTQPPGSRRLPPRPRSKLLLPPAHALASRHVPQTLTRWCRRRSSRSSATPTTATRTDSRGSTRSSRTGVELCQTALLCISDAVARRMGV